MRPFLTRLISIHGLYPGPRKQWALLPLFLTIAIVHPCLAGGTIDRDELDPLLRQQPGIRRILFSTLRLPSWATADVRLGSHFEHLSGARIGPYILRATTLADGKPIDVTLCTQARFLDGNGTSLPDEKIETAMKVEERLIAVLLKTEATAPALQCP